MIKPPLRPGQQPPFATPYLLASLFLSGAACLVLELAGARLIAPLYGSSIYAWSSIITVTQAALALGYAWGGRQADRQPYLLLFARLLTAAGLTVAAIPWLRAPVLRACLPLGVQAGALASAAMLLGPTLMLLGALGPIAVRLTATGASDSGRKSGDAWAVSSSGSVLGAMLTGFILIPHLPISRILLGTALLLLLLGVLGLWLSLRTIPLGQLTACAACLGLMLLPTPKPRLTMSSHESAYGRIAVVDSPTRRYLIVNGISQSVMEKPGGESQSQYIHGFQWAISLRPNAKHALVIGLGAGLLPKALERRGLSVDAIELDPAIEQAARRDFGYEPRGRVVVGDGRTLLESGLGPWDVVFLDAFAAESPPSHLFTIEAFERMRGALSPDGVLAINIVSALTLPDDRPWKALHRTLSASFPHVRSFVASDPNESLANVLLFASAAPLEAGPPGTDPRVEKEIELMLSRELHPTAHDLEPAPVLTDDFAPLDALMAGTALRWRTLLHQTMSEVLLD